MECFIPTGLAEFAAFANQRRGETVLAIDVPPAELSLHASGDPVGWTMLRRHFENVAIFRPDIEAATHAAISAHCFGLADAVLSHRLFRFRDLKNASVAGLG